MEMFLNTMAALGSYTAAWVFLVSGAAKMMSLKTFRQGLLFIPYMTPTASLGIGYGLPVLEVGLGVGLILGWPEAALGSIVLLIAFIVVTLVVLRKRLQVKCNCFGNLDQRTLSGETIVQNLVLSGFLTLTALRPSQPFSLVTLINSALVILAYLAASGLANNRKLAQEGLL